LKTTAAGKQQHSKQSKDPSGNNQNSNPYRMVVIEFDLPRSVSLSALDDNNVTLKDAPENTGQESNKMVPRATLICRPNSHPFQVSSSHSCFYLGFCF